MKEFEFYNPTKLYFGKKSVEKLGEVAKKYGKKCMIVTRPMSSRFAETIKRIEGILNASGIETLIYDGVVPNPTVDSIDKGAAIGKEFGPDFIVGVGGGSAMDTSKCIAVAIAHEGSIWDYCFFQEKQPTEKTLPFLLVTTTSGTGSQMVANAVLTLTKDQHKSGVSGPYLFAKACFVDPELMLSVPEHITASTGFDVFCHSWESFTSSRCHPLQETLAREAIKIVIDVLPKLLKDLNNIEYREKMAFADTLAGMCINEAGVTIPHGVGMAISGYYPKVMHGESLSFIYPAYMRFTWDSYIEKFAWLDEVLCPEDANLPDEVKAKNSCEAMDKFLKEIGMWFNWADLGIDDEGAEHIIKNTFRLSDHTFNSRVPDENDIRNIVMDGKNR